MAYTKQQIVDYVRKLEKAGASSREIEDFVSKASQSIAPERKPEKVSALDVAKQYPSALTETIKGVKTGALKGIGSTLAGASSIGEKILQAPLRALGMKVPEKTGAEELKLQERLAPKTTAEKIGFGAEQFGEFLIPGGVSTKLGKAVELATKGKKLSGLAKLGARAGAEAGVFGGQTALQTGEFGQEAKSAAELGAAFPIAGAALKVGAKATGGALSEILGRTTGAGSEAIKEVYKNPNVVNFMRQASIGDIGELQSKIVEETRTALNVIKEQKRDNYVKQFSKIKGMTKNYDDILSKIRSDAGELISPERFGIRINTNEATKALNNFDFAKSTITEGERSVEKALNDIFSWVDTTPKGLDTLKKRLGDFIDQTPYQSPARALLTDIKSKLANELKVIPGYEKMTTQYSQMSNIVDEMTKALSLGDKTQIDTTIRKLMSTMRQNNEIRKSFLEYLAKVGNIDLPGKIAGVTLASKMPRGLQGSLAPSIGVGGGVAAIFNPSTIPLVVAYLGATSPRLVGEFVNLVGRIGNAPKELIERSPAIKKQIDRIFGESIIESKKPQPLFKGLQNKTKNKVGFSSQGKEELYGAVAGVEIDEEGNVTYSPEKGALGVLGMAGITKAKQGLGKADDLIQQAKKYKSAEEFVKAQGTPVYHGSTVENLTKLKISPNIGRAGEKQIAGIYLTPDYQTASYYGRKNGVQVFSPQEVYTNGKILKVDNFTELKTKLGLKDFSAESKAKIPNLLKGKGYDGVLLKQGGESNEMIITNPDAIKTKSQLIDIWNKANIDERLAPLADKDGMITVYRASAKFPKDKLTKDTFVATNPENAQYYAESWYKGDPSDIKIKSFKIPASKLKRGGSKDAWQLVEDFIWKKANK